VKQVLDEAALEQQDRTVFVGNLPGSISRKAVKKLFSE
jgi:RNA recognition motif-containing protein